MRLHRFFVAETIGNKKEIEVRNAELVNQLRRVFRLRSGDDVILFDGSGSDYTCKIADFSDRSVNFTVASVERSRYVPSRKVYLCAALVKKDNFEFIAEKATELGVTDIIPILAERTEKKALNEERVKKIVREASEQSGRGDVPVVHPITEFSDALAKLKVDGVDILAFHIEGEALHREDVVDSSAVAIFIGPEGGWSPNELDSFTKNNIKTACLGRQVLRAETAVISALSLLL